MSTIDRVRKSNPASGWRFICYLGFAPGMGGNRAVTRGEMGSTPIAVPNQ